MADLLPDPGEPQQMSQFLVTISPVGDHNIPGVEEAKVALMKAGWTQCLLHYDDRTVMMKSPEPKEEE